MNLFNRKDKKDKTGQFKVWKNDAGEWCIGNNCFRMRATEDGVNVAINPDGKSCPNNMNEALKQIRDLAVDGKPTRYRIPTPHEEKW